jgi:hypothetical protein
MDKTSNVSFARLINHRLDLPWYHILVTLLLLSPILDLHLHSVFLLPVLLIEMRPKRVSVANRLPSSS